jgi:hypothetical protein
MQEVAAAAASQQAIRTRRSGALGSSLGEPLISSNTAGASSGLPGEGHSQRREEAAARRQLAAVKNNLGVYS